MFLDVLLWVIFIGIASIICLPLNSFIFNKESVLIKLSLGAPLSLIFIGLISWVSFYVLNDIYLSYFFSLTVFFLIFFTWLFKNRKKITYKFIYDVFKFFLILIITHVLFLALRGFNGDLIGTEKLMDHMMLSSAYFSNNGMVPDLWFSGYENPYYYFGYWIYGGIIRLTNTSIIYGYNISLSTTFSLSLIASWAISFQVLRKFDLSKLRLYFISSLGPLFLLFITNFYILIDLLSRIPLIGNLLINLLKIKDLGEYDSNFLYGSGWRSTRVIDYLVDGKSLDYTIQEYPSFSFILGDLHPHMLSIPFFLITSYLILSITSTIGRNAERPKLFILFLIGLLIPIMGFINIWDLPLFLFLFITCYSVSYLKNKNKINIYELYLFILGFIISILILYDYYFSTLDGQTEFPLIAINLYSTNIIHFIIVAGLPLLIIYWSIFKEINLKKFKLLKILIHSLLVSIAIFILRIILGNAIDNEVVLINYLLSFLSTFILIVAIYIILKEKLYVKDFIFFSISLTILSILLIVEHVHLIDLFKNRMNTIFKSYYQIWILASIAFPIFISRIFDNKKYMLLFIVPVITISFVQNLSTFLDNTNNLSKEYTLDTSAEIEKRHPGSINTIEWINNNTNFNDVIFSGVGEDYKLSSFFSIFTGRQTPLGWPGHENQWRGNEKEINERNIDLLKLFNSKDINEIEDIINKYNISYIIDYKNTSSYLFNIYNKIYSSGSCSVYITK